MKLGPSGIRKMFAKNYQSAFSPDTGIITRITTNEKAISPVPEVFDLDITDKCRFNCPYCYKDSKGENSDHIALDMVQSIIDQWGETKPYQVALGGGEPTEHPQFVEILRMFREAKIWPNYTTAGYKLTPEIAAATNQYCGGVAITFHSHVGPEVFLKTFKAWRAALTRPINFHVVANTYAVKQLNQLLAWVKSGELDPKTFANVVLLQYEPQGRGTDDLIWSLAEREVEVPSLIKQLDAVGVKLAFSEGLLPYFQSRNILDTRYASPMEGRFSAYVTRKGKLCESSFRPSGFWGDGTLLQKWENDHRYPNTWDVCDRCALSPNRCVPNSELAALQCAFMQKVTPPASHRRLESRNTWSSDGTPTDKVTSVIQGWVTNSSSVVSFFDPRVLEDAEVQRFIKLWGVEGFVPTTRYGRGDETAIILTPEQRREYAAIDCEYEDAVPTINPNTDRVILAYSDEVPNIAAVFAEILGEASIRLGLNYESADVH